MNSIEHCQQQALLRWNQPSPHFSHGADQRSSDAALLMLLYGELAKASHHDWQNAGRVMVDRTYLRILLESYQLALPVRPLDQVSRSIDNFIGEEINPHWVAMNQQTYAHINALELGLAIRCFGAEEYLPQAALLRLFLLPMLIDAAAQPYDLDLKIKPVAPPTEQLSPAQQAFYASFAWLETWWCARIMWQCAKRSN